MLTGEDLHLNVHVLSQIDDSGIFPSEVGSTFPGSFKEVVKKIFKRLFRVYAHIYHSHFHEICSLKAEAHLNTCFKHFILFAKVCCPITLHFASATVGSVLL